MSQESKHHATCQTGTVKKSFSASRHSEKLRADRLHILEEQQLAKLSQTQNDHAAELAEPRSQTLLRSCPGGGTIVLGVEAVSCSCSHSPSAICVCRRIFCEPPRHPCPIVSCGGDPRDCSSELLPRAHDLPLVLLIGWTAADSHAVNFTEGCNKVRRMLIPEKVSGTGAIVIAAMKVGSRQVYNQFELHS